MNVCWNCSLNLLKDKNKMQHLQLRCCDCWCTGDGCNWGISMHNILSGTVITSETLMYVDTALSKRRYSAKLFMTADELVKCGPKGISGHNCIYLNIYICIYILKSHPDMSRLSLKENNVYADMAGWWNLDLGHRQKLFLCVIEFFISHLGSLKKTTDYKFDTFNVMTADELGWHVD